jgi:hypothetical protein
MKIRRWQAQALMGLLCVVVLICFKVMMAAVTP